MGPGSKPRTTSEIDGKSKIASPGSSISAMVLTAGQRPIVVDSSLRIRSIAFPANRLRCRRPPSHGRRRGRHKDLAPERERGGGGRQSRPGPGAGMTSRTDLDLRVRRCLRSRQRLDDGWRRPSSCRPPWGRRERLRPVGPRFRPPLDVENALHDQLAREGWSHAVRCPSSSQRGGRIARISRSEVDVMSSSLELSGGRRDCRRGGKYLPRATRRSAMPCLDFEIDQRRKNEPSGGTVMAVLDVAWRWPDTCIIAEKKKKGEGKRERFWQVIRPAPCRHQETA